jgi:ADP-heptose:LPS heptosyltransferase
MRFFVFGNPDLEVDSLPIQLIPELQKEFPDITFEVLDPNEEWDVPKHMNIIDTVVGIDEITVFEDLNTFVQTPKMTCHDFDAYTNLQFLKKLGKIDSVYIIGIPSGHPRDRVKTNLYKAIGKALES